MTSIKITSKIREEYIKTLKDVLLTPKTKKFTAKTKRFFTFLKSELHFTRYKEIIEFLENDDIHNLIRNHGVIPTDETNYDIYDDFRNEWAKRLVELLGIKVCPYCNRNFIVNIDKGTTVRIRPFFFKE